MLMTFDPGVARNIVEELAAVIATWQWPQQPPSDTLRGVDFYSGRDLVGALVYAALQFKGRQGYLPSLTSPQTFSEHIFKRKFFAPIRMPSLANKLAAYEYVQARVGDIFLPSVVWVGDDVRDLWATDLDSGRFVLKANNGYKFNMFLELPNDLIAKRREIERTTARWLDSRFGYSWGEWWYCTFKARVFLERFLDFNGKNVPDDFKFFCFAGKALVVEVDVNRFTELRTAFYDTAWNHIPVAYRHKPIPIKRDRPDNLEQMIWVAETLAKDMEFARIDLYSDGKREIRFGEITLSPGNAISRFSDPRFDRWLGSLFGKGPHTQFQ